MSKFLLLILSTLIINSIQADHCLEKDDDDVCISCELGYYLDKSSDNECKDSYLVPVFHNCNETEDGETCASCNEGYFFAKNGECVNTENCKKSQKRLSFCEECDDGFYLLSNGLFCASTKHCIYGDRETGKCTNCETGYYLDTKENKCKSNRENNGFKNCKKGNKKCEECVYNYYLGEDDLCSLSKNCSESDENGTCIECAKGYHLSSYDNKCTKVDKCLKVNNNFECEECEKFLLLNNSKCVPVDEWENAKFTNCKYTNGAYCTECKDNYYLNQKNNFCVLNIYMKDFKYCAKSDISGEYCEVCEKGYYLGTEDNICTPTFGCAASENGVCKKCKYSFCLNRKNECIRNTDYMENYIYYKCRKTNNADTACILCEDGYNLFNGKCLDTLNCKERPFGNCVKCKQNYCLSNLYGCVNLDIPNCERCDSTDLGKCTGCEAGYYLNEKSNICEKCKNGCATCSDENNCGSCDIGYFTKKMESKNGEFDAECGQCPEGCKDCYDEKSCLSCKEGFYVVRGNAKEENVVCNKCSDDCLECSGPTKCLKCRDGFYLSYSGHSAFCLKLD